MSQNRSNQPQQQGLQTTRQQPGQGAVAVSGKLSRLPERGGSTTNHNIATEWIDDAYQQTGLVAAPFGNTVPAMPPGYAVSMTPVQVTDFNDGFDGTQIYPIKGSKTKKGLLKAVMDDLATGMGFDWPPQWTWVEKFGDERDNDRLCQKITVCGRYKDVDGSWKTAAPQTKEIDLREGSDEVKEIRARQLAKALYDLPPNATPEARAEREKFGKRNADAELAGPRKYIRSYAQTKARLMVVATKVRRSYTLEELKRGPIYCFRVIQTWRSDDPETQKQFNAAIIEREMGSSAMLYGAPAPRELPPASNEPYPEQEDAGVVDEASATAGDSGTGQPEGAGAPAATVGGESGSNQPQQKQCSPETGCLGTDPGIKHILACYGTAGDADEVKPKTEEKPVWKLTQGPAKNLPVNDPKVQTVTLVVMRNELAAALKPNGLVYDSLSDEKKDLFSGELREIQKELDRRGVKD